MAKSESAAMQRVRRKAKQLGLYVTRFDERLHVYDEDGLTVCPASWPQTGNHYVTPDEAEQYLDTVAPQNDAERAAFALGGLPAVADMRVQ